MTHFVYYVQIFKAFHITCLIGLSQVIETYSTDNHRDYGVYELGRPRNTVVFA